VADLGLFTPANPVTHATPAAAVAAGLAAGPQSGDPCEGVAFHPTPPPGKLVTLPTGQQTEELAEVPALPPELAGRGFIRARDCYAQLGRPKYANKFQAQMCGAVFFAQNPWVDCATKRALAHDAAGRLLLIETPCLTGYGKAEYKRYDLEGHEVCSVFPADANPQDPFPDGKYVGGDPGKGLPFGRPGLPGVGTGGRGLPITVSGVNVADIGRLLSGAGATVDVGGIISVLAALVLQGGNIRGALDSLPGQLGDSLNPALGYFASSLDRLVPGVGVRLATALDGHGKTVGDQIQDHAAMAAAAIVPVVGPIFAELVNTAPGTLAKLSDVYKTAIEALIASMLRLFRDDIEAHAPVTPANVDRVAAGALGSAITAGSVAQLSGMALELLHPLKTMGVQQAIGVLAEFAGFSEIARPYFGATLRYGIGLPAEHRAAAHFRTVLPGVGLVKTLTAKGIVPFEKYRERLILEGYPEPYPAAFLADTYAEISPRALSAFTDGSEADRPWLARKLRGAQLSPEDADRVVRALELKATQPGRSKVVATLLGEYQHGRLSEADLSAGLAGAGLSVTHRAYYLRAAQLDRRGYRMELIAAELTRQYVNDVVGRDAAGQLLLAVGFAPDEVTLRLTTADLRRGLKQVQDEVKGTEAEIRALKAKGLANATRQLRAGFLDRAQFVAVGAGMGYAAPFMENVADVAALEGAPTTTADAPAIGAGALLETQGAIADLITHEVQVKRADRLAALAQLRKLGLPGDLASTLIDLAEAIGGPEPFGGDYGLPADAQLGGTFEGIAQAVLGGLHQIGQPADLVTTLLRSLNLPGHDGDTLRRLLGELRTVFHAGN